MVRLSRLICRISWSLIVSGFRSSYPRFAENIVTASLQRSIERMLDRKKRSYHVSCLPFFAGVPYYHTSQTRDRWNLRATMVMNSYTQVILPKHPFHEREKMKRTMAQQDTAPFTHVQFDTTMGSFVIELYYR
jgi:hypothetical protein